MSLLASLPLGVVAAFFVADADPLLDGVFLEFEEALVEVLRFLAVFGVAEPRLLVVLRILLGVVGGRAFGVWESSRLEDGSGRKTPAAGSLLLGVEAASGEVSKPSSRVLIIGSSAISAEVVSFMIVRLLFGMIFTVRPMFVSGHSSDVDTGDKDAMKKMGGRR